MLLCVSFSTAISSAGSELGGTGSNGLAWHYSLVVLRWSRGTDAQPDRNCNTTPNTYGAVGTWRFQAWTPANFNEMKTRSCLQMLVPVKH